MPDAQLYHLHCTSKKVMRIIQLGLIADKIMYDINTKWLFDIGLYRSTGNSTSFSRSPGLNIVLYRILSMRQTWTLLTGQHFSNKNKKCQHSGIWSLYLRSPWEMQLNKYKHAYYWFRNLWNFRNQTILYGWWNQWPRAKY